MEGDLENIEKSRFAEFGRNQNQYKAPPHRTRPLLRRDVDGHFNAKDHRALEKFRSELLFQVSTILTGSGYHVRHGQEEIRQTAYIEQLYMSAVNALGPAPENI